MKSSALYLITLLIWFLPETKCFRLKRGFYRFAGARIGNNVRICSSAKLFGNGHLFIGENTWIGHEALIVSTCSVHIGKYVDIAPRVYIGTGTHELDTTGLHSAGTGISKPVEIGDGAWLGAGSIILPGVKVGKKAVIAAGAVVTHDVEPNTLVGGVPAKQIKKF